MFHIFEKKPLVLLVEIFKKIYDRVLFVFVIPCDFVIKLVATRNLVFSYSNIFPTRHIGGYTERRFGATSFDKGTMRDYEEAIGGRQECMKLFWKHIPSNVL